MAGKRTLPGFGSVRVNLDSAFMSIGKDARGTTRSKVEVELWASVLVFAERSKRFSRNSRTYRTFVRGEAGVPSELIPVPPPALGAARLKSSTVGGDSIPTHERGET